MRRHAVRLAEPLLPGDPKLQDALLALVEDQDPQVLLQLAYSLGEWPDPRAAAALGRLAVRQAQDEDQLSAVLSSVNRKNVGSCVAIRTAFAGAFASTQRYKSLMPRQSSTPSRSSSGGGRSGGGGGGGGRGGGGGGGRR